MRLADQALLGHRVVVPGGTGGVGEGIVRRYLAAGAEVVVPVRSARRADELRNALADAPLDHLHLIPHGFSTFADAADLAEAVVHHRGGVDSVVAPIGGWWAGGPLTEIEPADWQAAFVDLATAHMAVLRAFLPLMGTGGAYTVIVGDSAAHPAPNSGLVSMEQAALLMMQRVVAAEAGHTRRVFALVLGQVATRLSPAGAITADQVGHVAAAASASHIPGEIIGLHSHDEVDDALRTLDQSDA